MGIFPDYLEDKTIFDEKDFFEGNRFKFYEFALFLFEEYHGCYIDNRPHVFTGKKYEPLNIDVVRKMTIKYIPSLREQQNKEVYQKLKPFSPNYYITNIIDIDFDKDAQSDLIEKFIKDISNEDEEVEQLIYEMIGYGLYRDNFLQVAFFYYSPGGNGKTTLLKLLHYFYSPENTTALSFNDLNDKFKPANLQGKLVNIADDIDSNRIKDTGNFKIIVTGNYITLEFKGQDAFEFKPYVKLIFASNELPMSNDKSEDFYRRMVIIPMLRKFGKGGQKKDPMLINKLTTPHNMSALLNLALKGLKRTLENNKIIEPQIAKKTKEEYQHDNNPVLQFIEDAEDKDYRQLPVVEGRNTDKAYEIYQIWCANNGYHHMNKFNFSKELSKIGYKTVSYYSRAEEKSKRFYKKDNTTIIYDTDGNVLKKLTVIL
ncbi:DNA primase [Staphylococcus pseudintermedius]|nr:DNA primase [Staphylococcus pseudintermedius]